MGTCFVWVRINQLMSRVKWIEMKGTIVSFIILIQILGNQMFVSTKYEQTQNSTGKYLFFLGL